MTKIQKQETLPMAAPDRFNLTCMSCNRPLMVTLQQLAKRRACSYCGKMLLLPREVENALSAMGASVSEDTRPEKAIAAECPICVRVSRIKALPGTHSKCMFCGCPIVIPAQDGPAKTAAPDEAIPRLQQGEGLAAYSPDLRCPNCKAPKLTATDPFGTTARCGACGTGVDCSRKPLTEFVDLAEGLSRTPMTQLAREALSARWSLREVSLLEAVKIFELLDAIGASEDDDDSAFSPLEPQLTREIVQWAILCEPQVTAFRDGHGMGIEVEISDSVDVDLNVENVVAGTKQELKNVGQQMKRALVHGAAVNDKAFARLVFSPTPDGTELAVRVRHTTEIDAQREPQEAKKRRAEDADMVEYLEEEIFCLFHDAARQYLAFKALFGIWATPSMYNAATERGLQRRLESLGEPLRAKAAVSAKLLTVRHKLGSE